MHLAMVVTTMVLFGVTLVLNEWLFAPFEVNRGISWVYLPAGVRLLSTLLFGASGAVGLLLASWIASFTLFFPDDAPRAFVGGVLSTVAPYGVYLLARHRYGLQASLSNLTPGRLMVCIAAYAVASPALHHIWFILRGDPGDHLHGFVAMCVGDFVGALIVIYTMKGLLSVLSWRRNGQAGRLGKRSSGL